MPVAEELPPPCRAYLLQVQKALSPLRAPVRAELVRELASHLEDGLASGMSPDAAIATLGNPEDVARALVAERLNIEDREIGEARLALMSAKATMLPFALTACIAYLGLRLGGLSAGVSIASVATNAGLAAFSLWVGVVAMGFYGWPVLARHLTPDRLSRASTARWMVGGSLGVAVLLSYVLTGTHLIFDTTLTEQSARVTMAREVLAHAAPGPALAYASRDLAELEGQRVIEWLIASSTVGSTALGLAFGYLRAQRISPGAVWAGALGAFIVLFGAFFGFLVATAGSMAGPLDAPVLPVFPIAGFCLLLTEIGLALVTAAWAASVRRTEVSDG